MHPQTCLRIMLLINQHILESALERSKCITSCCQSRESWKQRQLNSQLLLLCNGKIQCFLSLHEYWSDEWIRRGAGLGNTKSEKNAFKGIIDPKIYSPSGHPRCRWVYFFIRFGEMCHCISVSAMDALQWMGAVRMRVNGCSAVNGCRQNESQWMLCSEWVPSEWESDKNITIIHSLSVIIWRRQKLCL